MICGRNVFLKYGLGAKCLSEKWFGCETSYWTMKTGAKRLSYLWGEGETSFLNMSWGRNVSLKNGANWLWGEKSVYPWKHAMTRWSLDVDPMLTTLYLVGQQKYNNFTTLPLQGSDFGLLECLRVPMFTNNRYHTNVGSMLAHRLRHWSNIRPLLVQHFVFAG